MKEGSKGQAVGTGNRGRALVKKKKRERRNRRKGLVMLIGPLDQPIKIQSLIFAKHKAQSNFWVR